MAFFTWVHAGMARFYETARGEGRLGRHFATGYLAVAVLCVIVGGAYVAAVGLLGLSEAVRTALFFGLAALLLRSILMMGLRSAECRCGKEGVRSCQSLWSPFH